MTHWLLIVAGAIFGFFALYAQLRHKGIWENSLHRYARPRSAFIHALIRPSKLSYYANIYIVLPVIFALAILSIIIGILLFKGDI